GRRRNTGPIPTSPVTGWAARRVSFPSKTAVSGKYFPPRSAYAIAFPDRGTHPGTGARTHAMSKASTRPPGRRRPDSRAHLPLADDDAEHVLHAHPRDAGKDGGQYARLEPGVPECRGGTASRGRMVAGYGRIAGVQ